LKKNKKKILEADEEDLTNGVRTYVLGADSEEERKEWIFLLWKLILDQKAEKEKDGKKKIEFTPAAIAAAANKAANSSASANFGEYKRALLKAEEEALVGERGLWNFFKHKHKVLCLFFVYEVDGLPRLARVYLWALDLILSMFMTVLFLYLALKGANKLTPPEQSALTVTIGISAGFIWKFILSTIYKQEETGARFGLILFLLIIPVVVLLSTMAFFDTKLGSVQALNALIRFFINLGIGYVVETLLLVIGYYILKHHCTCLSLDDRTVANSDIEAARKAIKRAEESAKKRENDVQGQRVQKARRFKRLAEKKKLWNEAGSGKPKKKGYFQLFG